jgi:WD40 repeat protein
MDAAQDQAAEHAHEQVSEQQPADLAAKSSENAEGAITEAWSWTARHLVCSATAEYAGSLDRGWTGSSTGMADNNLVKTVHFSPDGTCVLSASEDSILRVYEVWRLVNHSLIVSIWSSVFTVFELLICASLMGLKRHKCTC